ncbi:MAG: NAD(P)-dependent glycerol-3-phosphate dehydrogenase [Clostridiales Family XIII bacterium]|nr:NAD(P)-dependent glycerol-3-phosphate dehydrogenase [Clostridiales Family XIII bacterium]
MKKIAIIGAGSFGTALSVIAKNNGYEVSVFDIDKDLLDIINKNSVNKKYLPFLEIPEGILFSNDIEKVLIDSEIILFAVPTQFFRSAIENITRSNLLKNQIIVNVAKGIEQKTLKLIPEIAEEFAPKNPFVHLAGPSHAEEVASEIPTAILSASKNKAVAKIIQEVFSNDSLRVYTGSDIIGASIGGAVKNVIALGCGISDGLKFGDNTKAAIMTRSLVEMKRLGKFFGADEKTFFGLTGIGDLIVTCTSIHSRNRRAGILIGEGKTKDEAEKDVKMVVEGISTADAIYRFSKEKSIDMPICSAVYRVTYGKINPKEGVLSLMNRKKKDE